MLCKYPSIVNDKFIFFLILCTSLSWLLLNYYSPKDTSPNTADDIDLNTIDKQNCAERVKYIELSRSVITCELDELDSQDLRQMRPF